MRNGKFRESLTKLIGISALAGSLLLPMKSFGHQDLILLKHDILLPGDGRGSELRMGKYGGSLEGKDGNDTIYIYPPLWEDEWAPKAFTEIEGYNLSRDLRPTNSLTDYHFNFGVVIQNGQDINGQNILGLRFTDNSTWPGLSQKMHYTISYNYNENNFVEGGMPGTAVKNIRDLCLTPNVIYYWTNSAGEGVKIDVPFADADENGQVVFGTGILRREWNQLVSTKQGNGTASFEGSEILDYGISRIVNLEASQGNYIKYYILHRNGKERQRIVTTNSFFQGDVTSTNVSLENLMGSNSLHVVYSPYLSISASKQGAGAVSPNSLEGLVPDQQVEFDITADEYNHISKIRRVNQESTNTIYSAETNPGIKSTNLVYNVQGDETLLVDFAQNVTFLGTPEQWYADRGVTNNFETVDTSSGTGGFTGREKYIMNVDSLEDDSDYFRTISLSSSNGIPRITIPHSKTNRNYIVEGTGSLFPSNWQYKTNSLGAGGPLILDMTEDKNGTWFYRGKVDLEE